MPQLDFLHGIVAEKATYAGRDIDRCRIDVPVARMIGCQRGTGGACGVRYLRRMVDTVRFSELCTTRSAR